MKARGSSGTQARSSGFALIVVLWFLVLITAIGTYLMANARTETAIARNIGLAAGAEALADAGIAQAAFNLTDAVESNRWRLDGTEHRLKLAAGEIRIRLFDENAKVNPNHASEVLLAALFESAGVERMRARRLGAAIADWVGPDMTARPLGAKLEEYRQAGLSYGPPNAPIESLDELQLVLGMTREIFTAVQPYLTIYTDRDEPDPRNAPAVLQRALLLASRQKPAGGSADANEVAKAPVLIASDPDAPPPTTTPDAAAPGPATSAPSDGKKPDAIVVNVNVIAQTPAGGVFVRHAVLRLDPANPKGYAVLDWRRSELAASD